MSKLRTLSLNLSKEQIKRVSKNFISLVTLNSSLTLSQILFPPLMITFYGLENFGIWVFLTALPSVLSILNFDLNEAAKTEMSIYFNKNNKNKINEIFNNSIILTIIFIFILSIIGFVIINFYNFKLEILKNLNSDELNLILICVFLSFYLNIFNSIFKTGITYWGRLDISTYIETFFDLSSKVLIIILGIFFEKLIFAFIALLIVGILKTFIFYFFFLSYNKYLTLFSFNLISKKLLLKLFKLSVPYYLDTSSNIIKHSFQIIIIGTFFNAQVVGLISTFKTLFYFLPLRVWSVFSKVIFYEFTKLYAEKKFNKLKYIYFKSLKIGSLFIVTFIILSFLMGEYLYSFWLNNSYNFDYYLLILIVLDLVFFISARSAAFINKSINKFFETSLTEIIINLLIIINVFFLFVNNQSIYYLFVFNLIGSIIIFIYSIYYSLNLKIFQKYKY